MIGTGLLKRFRDWRRKISHYHCPKCGLDVPKKTAKLSGATHSDDLHVHCPRCNTVIASNLSLKRSA